MDSKGSNSILKQFASLDIENLGPDVKGYNFINGEWVHNTKNTEQIIDPMTGDVMITQPEVSMAEAEPYIEFLKSCPKSGLHNPLKNRERYILYGEVCRKVVAAFQDKEVWNYFVRCIQRTCPKDTAQASGEVKVVVDFFKNFCGDNVRYLAKSNSCPGDHAGC